MANIKIKFDSNPGSAWAQRLQPADTTTTVLYIP